jgi:hypothetical protein
MSIFEISFFNGFEGQCTHRRDMRDENLLAPSTGGFCFYPKFSMRPVPPMPQFIDATDFDDDSSRLI